MRKREKISVPSEAVDAAVYFTNGSERGKKKASGVSYQY